MLIDCSPFAEPGGGSRSDRNSTARSWAMRSTILFIETKTSEYRSTRCTRSSRDHHSAVISVLGCRSWALRPTILYIDIKNVRISSHEVPQKLTRPSFGRISGRGPAAYDNPEHVCPSGGDAVLKHVWSALKRLHVENNASKLLARLLKWQRKPMNEAP